MSLSKVKSAGGSGSPIHERRSDLSAHSCVSMKSVESIEQSVNFTKGVCSTEQSSICEGRSDLEHSCVSMKSVESIEQPVNFTEGVCSTEQSSICEARSDLSEHSCVSMKSVESIEQPVNFTEGICATEQRHDEESQISCGKDLESIFKELEHKFISLVKNELDRFKKLLRLDYSACGEEEEEGADQSCVRQGALKITLHILQNMNQTDLAKTLLTKLAPEAYKNMKLKLRKKFETINEGISKQENSALLTEIYTELYITEGESGEVINEHEVRQIETASRRLVNQETSIKCSDIFKPLTGPNKPIRTVLTKGVAGIGKTVSVQKFVLDWAEGKANQDMYCIFPLPFRELNLMKNNKLSLIDLLVCFFPETKDIRLSLRDYYKIIFIFDGLDECRLPLDFHNNESLFDVTQSASVDVLLTNLIKGNLLPSALLWITSRPAACDQIPSEFIDQVTEVRGFSDPQKEEYFRKRISDESLADKIIRHIKSSRSLYIMCHIPVFCRIAATVLERIFSQVGSREIPKTLTQMFTHFVTFQTRRKSIKYDQSKCENSPKEIRNLIMALGKLAFQQLENGNLIFYEEDLRSCGIDIREISVYSGLCTQIFKEELGQHLGKVFSFVHLTIQEFLAAFYALASFINKGVQELQVIEHSGLSNKATLSEFLRNAVDKALQSKNGHLDLFIRFLLGLSIDSSPTLLQSLLMIAGSSSHKEDTVKYIKKKLKLNLSPKKTVNLFHCLNELNDHSLVQDVQALLSGSDDSCFHGVKLSPVQWSAIVYVLLNSEDELKEFKLNKYDPSEECLHNLLPVFQEYRKAWLSNCNLTEKSCAVLASALSSSCSNLRDLNLNNNELQDSGVKLLSDGLLNPHCKLEKLSLNSCSITKKSCDVLASVLSSNISRLKELDLSYNELNSGVTVLSAGLNNPHCKLEKLSLYKCNLGEEDCVALISALKSNPSHLRELNLGMNKPGDSGVEQLGALLEDPNCKVVKLKLFNCGMSEKGCAALISAVISNPSQLTELDLRWNSVGDTEVKLLSDLKMNPQCKLETLLLINPHTKTEDDLGQEMHSANTT